jgi:hypothetical protein
MNETRHRPFTTESNRWGQLMSTCISETTSVEEFEDFRKKTPSIS